MKVLIVSLLCVCAGGAAGGAVHWPGASLALSAPLLNTVIPGHTKAFGYSTTQYINALPLSYQVGLNPQFAYQVPQLSGVSALQTPFIPVPGASYYPASVFYPPVGSVSPIVPGAPAAPGAPPSAPPAPSQPAPPEQAAGDSDSAVVDAADAPQPQQQTQDAPPQSQSVPIPPASTFPSFPPVPQLPQDSFSQIPQLPQGSDTIFPQIPQIPQGSLPGLPQFPQIPTIPPFSQSPSPAPPSSFPAADSGDKGLNDEDTISVESA